MKNVIFCVLDAVMPSRTGFLGSNINTTPFLDTLAQNSMVYSNTFSMGNPTEFAIPGIHASTNLFDFGGISKGISNRPLTLAEVLEKKGYKTCAFFPIYRPFTHGYERGFSDFYRLYDIDIIEKNFINSINHYKKKIKSNKLKKKE